jgi:hypothetical protein
MAIARDVKKRKDSKGGFNGTFLGTTKPRPAVASENWKKLGRFIKKRSRKT